MSRVQNLILLLLELFLKPHYSGLEFKLYSTQLLHGIHYNAPQEINHKFLDVAILEGTQCAVQLSAS